MTAHRGPPTTRAATFGWRSGASACSHFPAADVLSDTARSDILATVAAASAALRHAEEDHTGVARC